MEIEFKDHIWVDGFPTIIQNEEHARRYAMGFAGAVRFKFRGAWHTL